MFTSFKVAVKCFTFFFGCFGLFDFFLVIWVVFPSWSSVRFVPCCRLSKLFNVVSMFFGPFKLI